MPLEVIESTDPIASLIRFQTSSVYEMMISLHTLLKPGSRAEWASSARAKLPADFLVELEQVYGPYFKGALFFELGVDYPDQNDVPGFIRYVEAMDPATFLFYYVGRIITTDEIEQSGFTEDGLMTTLRESPYGEHCWCMQAPLDVLLADVPGFQRRLVNLWQRYWDLYFKDQVASLYPHWDQAIGDKNALLNRISGQEFYEHVTGKSALMPALPAEYPTTEIVFIPQYLMPLPVYMFYGYGNITVLFDSERTEARLAEIHRHKEQVLNIFKALSDGSRLDVLRLIAQSKSEMNGKKIAQKLNLSASAVSRHLTQLKEAGVIVEDTQDNRTITYELQMDTLKTLSEVLLEVLYH